MNLAWFSAGTAACAHKCDFVDQINQTRCTSVSVRKAVLCETVHKRYDPILKSNNQRAKIVNCNRKQNLAGQQAQLTGSNPFN